MKSVRILVTGGGTGGHVTPALAVIQALQTLARGADWTPVFRYVGSQQGIERRLVTEAGIDFVGVASGKLRRSSSLRGLLTRKNFADAFCVPVGIVQALAEVGRFQPDVVFATGGYVSVPPVVAAGLRGVPVLIHEQTVQIGLANKIAAVFATRIALTFEGAAQELPLRLRKKTFVTGNPVRAVVMDGDKERAITRFGFAKEDHALPTLYITGGAQGASSINNAVEAILPDLLQICRVVHQCGPADEERSHSVREQLTPTQRQRYFVAGFLADEIGDAFALADLIVGRSGAGTVTEAVALGKPAIFIPLVPTGGDEQTRNARRSVEAGAAVLLPGSELDGPRLLSEIRALMDAPEQRQMMAFAALTLATPNAAANLARAVLDLAIGELVISYRVQ